MGNEIAIKHKSFQKGDPQDEETKNNEWMNE